MTLFAVGLLMHPFQGKTCARVVEADVSGIHFPTAWIVAQLTAVLEVTAVGRRCGETERYQAEHYGQQQDQ
jgi:hypothetical protein